MLNPAAQIDLKELSLYLMNLISTSCELLHHFSMDSELSWKGKNNPVTEVSFPPRRPTTSSSTSSSAGSRTGTASTA